MEKLKVNSDICIGCGLCVSQNEEYFEFIGIFSLDTDKSTNNKRIWKKANLGDKVTLNIEDLLKNIAD